ncbi:hypothetical protein [Chryseobacterium oncorhynchi]|uniref:Uncharacterized protein n=1 Tax=Chryseobacterium oncorhynchi TaxID=741074 RepID=A0A316WCJ3_9FLAO|nr:hypothetical protein [Chryseobacterium oncorhynchi]PWN59142.1 hypothetical protein C1638_021845 [Chryseobacterium oncorhynchi]
MNTTDLIIKHLNALNSKYQLDIDLLTEMKKKPTNELHQAEIDINITYFKEEIKEIKEILEDLEREEKKYTVIPMGNLSEIKSIPINPVSNLLNDFIAGNVNEDEVNEIITKFDNIKKEYKPITFLTAYQQELIKDAETLLNEFKQSDDFAKNELSINVRNDFFDKFHDSFPDFCFILGRTLDSYYTIEVSEKYIELLKTLDYREAEKKMLIWCNENLYKL